jgi:hypothetical protein
MGYPALVIGLLACTGATVHSQEPTTKAVTCADWMGQFGTNPPTSGITTGDAWAGDLTATYDVGGDGTASCSTFDGTCTKTNIPKLDTANKFGCSDVGCTDQDQDYTAEVTCRELWDALSSGVGAPDPAKGGPAADEAVTKDIEVAIVPAGDKLTMTVTFAADKCGNQPTLPRTCGGALPCTAGKTKACANGGTPLGERTSSSTAGCSCTCPSTHTGEHCEDGAPHSCATVACAARRCTPANLCVRCRNPSGPPGLQRLGLDNVRRRVQ